MTAKIFRNSFLIGITVLLVSSVLFFAVMFSNYENQAFERLSAEAESISLALDRSGLSYLESLRASDRVTLIAPDGSVLFDNFADPAALPDHLAREEVQQALRTGTGRASRDSETVLERTHYYALRLSDGSVLRTACTQKSIVSMALLLLAPLLWVIALVLILCGVLSYRLAQQITRPINAIDLDDPVPDASYKELAPLVSRIQELQRTSRSQLDELSLRQREFTAITKNMREGFLLLDGRARILSGNQSAMQLLSLEPDSDPLCDLRTVCHVPELLSAVDTALAGNHAEVLLTREAVTWQVIANGVTSGGSTVGAVVLLMDVTEREQREALRREFSANVSHELKTPLTSISGFAELMQAGLVPPEKMQEFSADIYRESRRLLALVNDIIKLSRLDEGAGRLERQSVDLYALSQHVLCSLQSVAEQRNIRLTLCGEHISVSGAAALLEEMLYNLCDNAVKYNVDGGSVTVRVRACGGETLLTVSDTGIGIPYAHQSRVFERFYRVDKSHSKAVGGTGLGLSIVKHAAQYHNARLELQSDVGKGTEIRIFFPAARPASPS